MIGSRITALPIEFKKLNTADAIIKAITVGTQSWADDTDIPQVEALHLPNTAVGRLTAQAFAEQSLLGWNAFFRGFWTKSWRLAQEEHLRQIPSRKLHDTSERWSGEAQLWFISLFESIWGLRCADEHGADPETEILIRTTKCERAIRRLYEKGALLPHNESHPFRSDIADLLSQSVTNQELWITQTEAFLITAFRRVRKLAVSKQQAITAFFSRKCQ